MFDRKTMSVLKPYNHVSEEELKGRIRVKKWTVDAYADTGAEANEKKDSAKRQIL